MAYCIALSTSLSVPCLDIGLMPIPQSSVKRILLTPISSVRNFISFSDPSEPASHSTPAYISSEFSLKITISVFSGESTGLGTPLKYLTGL